MKLKSSLIAVVGLALVAVLVAQTGQTSQSNSQSQSGNGTSSSSSSSSGRAWSSGSASGGKNVSGGTSVSGRGTGNGSGNGSGFGFNGKPTHAIMYTLDSSSESADARQQAFQQHTRYLSELQGKGKVLLHGPWRDLPGSMAIVMAQSDNEATEIAKNDPAVKSGALKFEVRAWLVQAPTPSQGTVRAR